MRFLCVIPRYGDSILGGAENLVRGFAEHGARCGVQVDVLTTCVLDLGSQHNTLPAGYESLNGVRVWRYPVQPARLARRARELAHMLMTGQDLDPLEEDQWLAAGMHSPLLYRHLQAYGAGYDAIFCAPYPFPLIHYAATVCPARTIIWPCLHDEGFARLVATRALLESAQGVIYNSEPERQLAEEKLHIHQPHAEVAGIGVEQPRGDANGFRNRYGIQEPFILYAGRLEPSKNIMLLVDCFVQYRRLRADPLKLVVIGEGSVSLPAHPDICHLGYVDRQTKLDAYTAATLLCQPSQLESFSLVIMESWLAGVPVLVHRDCPVTRFHCEQSGGGLHFGDQDEFVACVDWFLAHPAAREQMGRQGRGYVEQNFRWQVVWGKVWSAVTRWLPEAAASQAGQNACPGR